MTNWIKPALGTVLCFAFVMGAVGTVLWGDARCLVIAALAAYILIKGS